MVIVVLGKGKKHGDGDGDGDDCGLASYFPFFYPFFLDSLGVKPKERKKAIEKCTIGTSGSEDKAGGGRDLVQIGVHAAHRKDKGKGKEKGKVEIVRFDRIRSDSIRSITRSAHKTKLKLPIPYIHLHFVFLSFWGEGGGHSHSTSNSNSNSNSSQR